MFQRFFGLFLLVVLVLYVLSFTLYLRGRRLASREAAAALKTRVEFSLGTLETEIERLRQIVYRCLNDTDLFYYVNAEPIMSEGEKFRALLAIDRRIRTMRDASPFVSDAAVYVPHLDWLITASEGIVHYSRRGEGDPWAEVLAAPADLSLAALVFCPAPGRLYLRAAYPALPVDPAAAPRYVILVELSIPALRAFLESLSLAWEAGEGSLLLAAPGGFSLAEGAFPLTVPAAAAAWEERLVRDGEAWVVEGVYSEYLNLWCAVAVPYARIAGPLRWYGALFLVFSLAAVGAVILFFVSSNALVNRPIKTLVGYLKRVEEGDLKARIPAPGGGAGEEFAYLYHAFNAMAGSLERMIALNYEAGLLRQKAELRQLQAQINPHFLYNGFFTLFCMAREGDYENLEVFLKSLSEYYRYIAVAAPEEATLAEEVDHARRYADIQLLRFKRRLNVEVAPLPAAYAGLKVPRLILQPLLENAFTHGLRDVASGGLVRVTFTEQSWGGAAPPDPPAGRTGSSQTHLLWACGVGGRRPPGLLIIRVFNNGKSFPREARDRGALVNIHERLRLRFGEGAGVVITGVEAGNVVVELHLPLGEDDVPAAGD